MSRKTVVRELLHKVDKVALLQFYSAKAAAFNLPEGCALYKIQTTDLYSQNHPYKIKDQEDKKE